MRKNLIFRHLSRTAGAITAAGAPQGTPAFCVLVRPCPPRRVFAPRRIAAAQVPLAEVDAEHLPHRRPQLRILPPEPIRHILMNGRFARSELLGAGTDGAAR